VNGGIGYLGSVGCWIEYRIFFFKKKKQAKLGFPMLRSGEARQRSHWSNFIFYKVRKNIFKGIILCYIFNNLLTLIFGIFQ